MSLVKKVAIVTGAGRGIGEAIAGALAAEGADVAVWDLDGARAADTAKRLADEHGVRSAGVEVDVADLASVDAAVEQTERELGPIDVLVNNAGIDTIEPFLESDAAAWDRIIAMNLRGTI